MRHNYLILLLALFAAGCATPKLVEPSPLVRPATLFPADAFITQRGVLTVHGRQFTLNGYVAKSETHGLRLMVTENFGGVLADVLVKPGGKICVLKSNAPFRPAWVEHYIAADLQCVFDESAGRNCPLQMLSQTHFIIERRWYKLDLRTVSVKSGAQPAEMFDEIQGGKL